MTKHEITINESTGNHLCKKCDLPDFCLTTDCYGKTLVHCQIALVSIGKIDYKDGKWYCPQIGDIDNQESLCAGFAHFHHAGQMRYGGAPYISHPMRVAEQCDTELEKCIAWLHDVFEDCGVTKDDALANGILPCTTSLALAMCKQDGETYFDYIRNVYTSKFLTKIKLRDIIDNLTDTPTDKQKAKYTKALLILAGVE